MIGRADIEGSKSNVAMSAWLPQASYPCGNFSDTSSLKFQGTKGSIGHDFSVCIHTENQNQVSFYPFVLHEISVLIELTLGPVVPTRVVSHKLVTNVRCADFNVHLSRGGLDYILSNLRCPLPSSL
jgi:hypothetical protein